jgi:hypothetical protein
MTRRSDTCPDLTRPEVGAPFFSTWRVGTAERQRQAVEAIARTWERRPWPAADLLGYHVYTGHDGSTLLHHSQWASEQAYEAFVKVHRQERNDEIDTAVPGIERLRLGRYRRYRSGVRDGGTRVPGCEGVAVMNGDQSGRRPSAWSYRLTVLLFSPGQFCTRSHRAPGEPASKTASTQVRCRSGIGPLELDVDDHDPRGPPERPAENSNCLDKKSVR